MHFDPAISTFPSYFDYGSVKESFLWCLPKYLGGVIFFGHHCGYYARKYPKYFLFTPSQRLWSYDQIYKADNFKRSYFRLNSKISFLVFCVRYVSIQTFLPSLHLWKKQLLILCNIIWPYSLNNISFWHWTKHDAVNFRKQSRISYPKYINLNLSGYSKRW